MANKRFLDTTMETDFLQSFVRGNLSAQETDTKDDKDKSQGLGNLSKRRESTKSLGALAIDTSEGLGEEKADHKAERKSSKQVKVDDGAGSICSKFLAQNNKEKEKHGGKKKVKRKTIKSEELYTDKDRAAAVNLGTRDIKQSLKLKRAQDRSRALHIPEEADPAQFLALGYYELKKHETHIALNFINKALELNPNEKHALVARSKCYNLLGQPESGLKDAEAALLLDKKFLKGIYQKAESLYYLGDFEHSLMYFHRGLHLRHDHEDFKLGVEKAQKAIETALGVDTSFHKAQSRSKSSRRSKSATPNVNDDNNNVSFDNSKKTKSETPENLNKTESRRTKAGGSNTKILKELAVDKEYLESLLTNPHLKYAKTGETDKVLEYVQETVDYLNKRQEFWRQQIPRRH